MFKLFMRTFICYNKKQNGEDKDFNSIPFEYIDSSSKMYCRSQIWTSSCNRTN